MNTVLVTGGAGYIGSHLVSLLLGRGDQVVVLDNLSRGRMEAVRAAEQLGGGTVAMEIGDLCDAAFVENVLRRWRPDAVVHCAAYKSADESVRDPVAYERANVEATRGLAEAMVAADCTQVVFASSAAVYGNADTARVSELTALRPASPYADTKVRAEILLDAFAEANQWGVCHLRFFNVCGAHPSGALGELPGGPPNLLPILLDAARSALPLARVFGTDWPTRDGTCIRDYVHVLDVASGILAVLDQPGPGSRVYNLGTGRGTTVLEMVAAVEQATGREIRVEPCPRRPGDPVASEADVGRIRSELAWEAQYQVADMAAHAWAWSQKMP